MLTTVLDVLGLCCLAAAAFLAAGWWAGLLVTGGACLWASWSMSRTQ